MKIFAYGAAAAALALAIPAAAPAQQLPPAVVAVVDTQRILQTCTACVGANSQLQAQQQQIEQRAQQLGLVRTDPNTPTPLEIEEQQIQAAIQAAQGNPDAALQQRIQAFRTRYQQATAEIESRSQAVQRNTGYVLQQLDERLNPIILQVMQQRGANIVVARNTTIMHNPAVEITDPVLALLNQQLPSVNVNAPPPTAQQQQQQQQQQRRPQGR